MILQLNMMKLVGNICRYYHFIKPTLSSITSAKDLQAIIQKRLVRNIQDVNAQTLQHYSFTNTLQQDLLLSEQATKDIEERTIKLNIINPATHQQQIVEAKINHNLNKLEIDGFGFDLPFPPVNQQVHHFSEKRGAPNFEQLQEYTIGENALYIFNLPQNISEQDIQATLKTNQIKISFKYCILGLPAYAKIYFQTQSELKACLDKIPSKRVAFGQRVAVIKSQSDADKLKLGYRRLVVELSEDSQFEHYALEFSKYGRVLHIDWPIEASLNPNIEEVKQFYQKSTELIKINKIYKDGTVQSEFYPTANYWDEKEDINRDNIIDHAERLKQSYEHRARFAKNVNVYVGKEHQTSFANRGYCVVTYSTYQECQSFYFTHSSDTKIELVGERLDFEWDKLFKKELLRQIDNEYLLGQKLLHEETLQRKEKFIEPVTQGFDHLEFHINKPNSQDNYKRNNNEEEQQAQSTQYNLFQKIYNKLAIKELTQDKQISNFQLKSFAKQNPFQAWSEYLRDFKDIKQKVNKQTFDEMAELELYGRVLPKDQKIERFIVEDNTYEQSAENRLQRQNRLITDERDLRARNKFYHRIQQRNNRLANRALGYQVEVGESIETEAVEGQVQAPVQADGLTIGKKQFSTRKPVAYYRKRTAQQEANFQIRYQQFVKGTIYQYMGVFHDKVIEDSAHYKPSIINPQSLTWPDATSYFTQEEVLDALQFRRNFPKAQEQYEDYVYGSQYVKSSGVNLTEMNSNFKDLQNHALQYLTDVGIVQNIKKVSGQNLSQKVEILNAQTSEFGEQYKLQEQNGQHTLIKVRKLQNLLPLHRVHHLQSFISEHGNDISPEQSSIFDKFYKEMKNSGVIPDEVSDAFGVERGKTLNQLFGQIGSVYKIYKKDLQMAQRAKKYSKQQVNEDIENQIKLQKYRKKYRKINSNNFAKDTTQIYTKDRQGYYKVSRYRQI